MMHGEIEHPRKSDHVRRQCYDCDGTGHTQIEVTCEHCGATHQENSLESCPTCNGAGYCIVKRGFPAQTINMPGEVKA